MVNLTLLIEFDVEPLQSVIEKPDGLPLPKPVVDRLLSTVAMIGNRSGQIAPGRSRTNNPEDSV